MDLNKMTQKVQEGLQNAQVKALRYGHQEVDGEHLLLSLIEQDDGLVPVLLKHGRFCPDIQGENRAGTGRKPRVTGRGLKPEQGLYRNRLNMLLVKASDEAKRLKDEYVSVEHVLLALLMKAAIRLPGGFLPNQEWIRAFP